MILEKILKLGDPKLYKVSEEVLPKEVETLKTDLELLHELIIEFRKKYGVGRGIAAPQIGLLKRIICLNIDNKKHTLINPELTDLSDEIIQLWDDCMCFPNLLVKVNRYKTCTLKFKDEYWNEYTWELEGDLSELIQHEYDHLDGILATQRAVDVKSFRIKK